MALGIVAVGGNMDPADYYNKTQADKLLAKKLDLTGGTMTGALNFSGGRNCSILIGEQDAVNGPGGPLNNLVIRSWNGVSFTTDSPNQTYTGKTAVGIDCRNGTIKAPRFEGVADNGVVASGAGYVRFGDGTQICTMELTIQNMAQGGTYEANNVAFPAPFSTVPTISTGSSWGWGEDAFFVGISYADFNIRILNCSSNQHSRHVIAIGRWK